MHSLQQFYWYGNNQLLHMVRRRSLDTSHKSFSFTCMIKWLFCLNKGSRVIFQNKDFFHIIEYNYKDPTVLRPFYIRMGILILVIQHLYTECEQCSIIYHIYSAITWPNQYWILVNWLLRKIFLWAFIWNWHVFCFLLEKCNLKCLQNVGHFVQTLTYRKLKINNLLFPCLATKCQNQVICFSFFKYQL